MAYVIQFSRNIISIQIPHAHQSLFGTTILFFSHEVCRRLRNIKEQKKEEKHTNQATEPCLPSPI